MSALPQQIISNLSQELGDEVKSWWDGLTDQSRQELSNQWDPRSDSCKYSLYFREDSSEWKVLPFEPGFVEAEEDEDNWELKREFFEYAVNHELLFRDPVGRIVHICRSHPEARKVIRNGLIPAGFACPVSDASCPMIQILSRAPGKSFTFACSVKRERNS